MPSRSWMNTPEYTHREDHFAPNMRPSMDLLLTKLRNMQALKHKPDAVEWLIGMLAHHAFVFERSHPDHLLRLMAKMDALWHLASGERSDYGFDNSKEREEVIRMESDPVLPDKKSTELSKDLFMASKPVRKAARVTIEDHAYTRGDEFGNILCEGSGHPTMEFLTLGEWATHVRRMVWEAMDAALGRSKSSGW